MIDTIVKLLRASGVYGWEIRQERSEGWEFYFIRHELDQNRAKRVEHIHMTVYQLIEDGQFIGSASAELAPTASEEEAKKLVEALAYRATLVKNRPYTLTPCSQAHREQRKSAPVALKKSDSKAFLPENGKIRLPYASLGGLGESAAENIAEACRKYQINSVQDLKQYAKLSNSVIELLRKEGVLTGLDETNQITMFSMLNNLADDE